VSRERLKRVAELNARFQGPRAARIASAGARLSFEVNPTSEKSQINHFVGSQ
jgi:hypothetical protein